LIRSLVSRLAQTLEEVYRDNAVSAPYSTDIAQSGKRALRNGAL
jgi:hypothetical protein